MPSTPTPNVSSTTLRPATLAPLAWASSLTSLSRSATPLAASSTIAGAPSSKRPIAFICPVRSSSLSASTSPDPHSPSARPSPMTPSANEPSSRASTVATAPSSAGMPHEIAPPSKAGPAGHEAARMRPRWPSSSSVLVPMSITTVSRSVCARSTASRQAAASAPTCPLITGRP
jgi:hypothetical protein